MGIPLHVWAFRRLSAVTLSYTQPVPVHSNLGGPFTAWVPSSSSSMDVYVLPCTGPLCHESSLSSQGTVSPGISGDLVALLQLSDRIKKNDHFLQLG